MQGIFFGRVWCVFAKMHRNNIIVMTFFTQVCWICQHSYFDIYDNDAALTDDDNGEGGVLMMIMVSFNAIIQKLYSINIFCHSMSYDSFSDN